MINALKNIYFRLNVLLLAVFNSTELFERINQLGWYQKTLRQWVDEQSFPANTRILEAGCATGALSEYLAQKGAIPTGIDFSKAMVLRAQKNHQDIEFLEANVVDMPFADNMFDAVLATSLINIVDDKNKAIHELIRTCNKGGSVSILVPNNKFTSSHFDVLLSQIGNYGFSAAVLTTWHKSAPKMGEQELTEHLEKAGLNSITVKYYLNNMVISVSGTKPPPLSYSTNFNLT